MLVAVLASVAGAETKKKTIKSMSKQQEQQQQVTNAQMTDYDWAVEYCYHEEFDKALTYINKHLKIITHFILYIIYPLLILFIFTFFFFIF